MASYKCRGPKSHSIIYYCKNESGENERMWESYKDELAAKQRLAFIEFLEKKGDQAGLREAASEYRQVRAAESAAKNENASAQKHYSRNDMKKLTLRGLAELWLPIYAKKKRLKPNTYDNHTRALKNHILPYLGDRMVSTLTALDIDQFLEHLGEKKCTVTRGSKQKPDSIPTLSSASIKKIYDCLYLVLKAGKAWGCMEEVPQTDSPSVSYRKRGYWPQDKVRFALNGIRENRLLHLAVHIAFICSLRSGEILGISRDSINFEDSSIRISQTLHRVSDEALAKTAREKLIHVFPKIVPASKSVLVLTKPKTEDSERVVYFNPILAKELRERMEQIARDKRYMGYSDDDYHDNGLLFAHPNGDPVEPNRLEKWFKEWQLENEIDPLIDIQGLRKSSSMYKLRISNFNYQEVQGDTGHTTPVVLMKHYNEVMDGERQELTRKVANDFYDKPESEPAPTPEAELDVTTLMEEIQDNPLYAQQLTQIIRNMMKMSQSAPST